ncbi:hypothetical protein [Xenorhabdus griffiniae]|uniref:hypothetical protein n=1 Tax=Xenorhabdus griffiniae TaxID=351672 RepID=UPI002358452D|nr:hypothetical protein [Xenorhabdus griffiniae]MDC9604739.1 hypothetical protein [Xenorhabdus griffiniae]
MIKKIIFLSLIVLCSDSFSSEWSDNEWTTNVGCFTFHGKKPININFVNMISKIHGYDDAFGYVKYEKSDKSIPIILNDDEFTILVENGTSVYIMEWDEMINGKPGGSYLVELKGDKYIAFTYRDKQNKYIGFEENKKAYDEEKQDCIWK